MASSAEIDTGRILLADTFTSGRGAKQILLSYRDGGAVEWQPRQALSVQWEPSAFNDETATRLNICFTPSPEVVQQLERFDEWAVQALSEQSQRLSGTALPVEEIKRRQHGARAQSSEMLGHMQQAIARTARILVACTVTPRIVLRASAS